MRQILNFVVLALLTPSLLPAANVELSSSTVTASLPIASSPSATTAVLPALGALPAAATQPAIAPTALPGVMPTPPDPAMNQMTGTIESLDSDDAILRLNVDGGFHVQFTYDAKTRVMEEGKAISIDDLAYGDEVVVSYVGKDLNAWKIERLKKAP